MRFAGGKERILCWIADRRDRSVEKDHQNELKPIRLKEETMLSEVTKMFWKKDFDKQMKKRDLSSQVEGYEIHIRQYTDVNVQQTERIRPYFALLHRSVLRSYFSVSYTKVYKSLTIANDLSNMSFRTVNDVYMQKRTANIYDDDKQPFSCTRRLSYFIVNDTEKYSRNTEPCNTECSGKIRSRRPY